MILIIGIIVVAYLLGSIPTSVWIGKRFYNIDVRQHGSGNAGATNTFRVLGAKAGIIVFIIDAFKGFIAVKLLNITNIDCNTNMWINFQLILGAVVVIGHIFPIFAGFKGGKGVATLFGLTIAINPFATLTAFIVFLIVVFIWKYISLGSMIAGISYPFWVIFLYQTPFISMKIFSIVVSVLLLLTHKKNIKRILKGEESKFSFKPKTIK
jgi:glycerol-3-phosphate acyltransferase PlsY